MCFGWLIISYSYAWAVSLGGFPVFDRIAFVSSSYHFFLDGLNHALNHLSHFKPFHERSPGLPAVFPDLQVTAVCYLCSSNEPSSLQNNVFILRKKKHDVGTKIDS